MEVEESSVPSCRKRTESNGGSSDSDLSEGWNIVDHSEVPSSDGESVEVIEGEDDLSQHDADLEVDESATEATSALVSQTMTTSVDEQTSLVRPAPREEMFDSSFCWFLVTAAFAILVSHLAFMAAENVLDWNTNMSCDFPSFLRDLPVASKPLSQKASWASVDDEVTIDSVDEMFTEESRIPVIDKGDRIQGKRNQNVNKLPLQIDNHELRNYFKALSNVTSSAEVQKKFMQSMLILEALHLGINDLEELVNENSELNYVLKKQRSKLNDVLVQVKVGVSRSLERLATNVFNKIQMLERRFEKQWCKLENKGHKEELKGVFYDCDESRHRNKKIKQKPSKKHSADSDNEINFVEKQQENIQMTKDNYKYEVDKDSTGKVHGKENIENGDNNEYYKLVKQGKIDKKYKIKHKLHDSTGHIDLKGNKFLNTKKPFREEIDLKQNSEKIIIERHHVSKEKHNLKPEGRHFDNTKRQSEVKKTKEEIISNYFKDICTKRSTKSNAYNKLKYEMIKKLKISEELFEQMYSQFCSHNTYNSNEELPKRHNKENTIENDNNFRHEQLVIEEPSTKNIVNFKIISSPEVRDQEAQTSFDKSKDKIIEPVNKQKWTLAYEIPQSVNKTSADGEWFIKSGESRSHLRWSHQRSEWWFDRSSQRRHYQHSYPHPPNWFVGRRKNWFFRRAWARQHCRESPHNSWCHIDDDTVTIPSSNFS